MDWGQNGDGEANTLTACNLIAILVDNPYSQLFVLLERKKKAKSSSSSINLDLYLAVKRGKVHFDLRVIGLLKETSS